MTTKDISSVLTDAASARWQNVKPMEVLQMIAAKAGPEADVDWDDGAGELWGCVLDATHVVGFVAMKMPLVVLTEEVLSLQGNLEELGVRVIIVPNMLDQVLTTTRDILQMVAGYPVSDAIDVRRFSAQELCWATI
jgi:hypothetical protein